MKLVQFLLLLFRQGSLHLKRVNFEKNRNTILDPSLLHDSIPLKSRDSALRRFLLNTPIGYSILANLAYLKNAGQMNKMYFVTDSHKVVYIRLLKCASTSMLREFLPLIDKRLKDVHFTDEQLDVLGFHYERKKIDPSQAGYKKFALVRDPFQRIVSVYLDLFDSGSAFTYASYWFGVLKPEMTFKEFIKIIGLIPTSVQGPHFAPQSYILRKAFALEEIRVFRIEKDGESLDRFLHNYGLSLPFLNRQPKNYDYRSYYDSDTLSVVEKLYEGDVEIFDYKEEHRRLQEFLLSQEKRAR